MSLELIESGSYVATHNNAIITKDDYLIKRNNNKIFIESEMTVFGPNGFFQKAECELDSNWQYSKIELSVIQPNMKVNLNIKDSLINIEVLDEKGVLKKDTQKITNNTYSIVLNGSVLIPLIWLRNFNFENIPKSEEIQIIPSGIGKVENIENISYNGMKDYYSFMFNIFLNNVVDKIEIICNKYGLVELYRSTISNIEIKRHVEQY